MTMNLPIAELDHLPLNCLSHLRLLNMRDHPGRREVPILVRRSRRGHWDLVDGQHRLAVARENGDEAILATDDGDLHP